MIQISIRRAGLIVLSATVHDDRSVTQSWGLTAEHARRRLSRAIDRRFP